MPLDQEDFDEWKELIIDQKEIYLRFVSEITQLFTFDCFHINNNYAHYSMLVWNDKVKVVIKPNTPYILNI